MVLPMVKSVEEYMVYILQYWYIRSEKQVCAK